MEQKAKFPLTKGTSYVITLNSLPEIIQDAATNTGQELVAGDLFQVVIEPDGTIFSRACTKDPLTYSFDKYIKNNKLERALNLSGMSIQDFLCSRGKCLILSELYAIQRTHHICRIYMNGSLTQKQERTVLGFLALKGKSKQEYFYQEAELNRLTGSQGVREKCTMAPDALIEKLPELIKANQQTCLNKQKPDLKGQSEIR